MLELIVLGGAIAFLSKVFSSPGSSSVEEVPVFSEDVKDRYSFDYRLVDGEWRAYIRRQPDYSGRPTGLHSTHRYHDNDGYYVCWSEPLSSREDCQTVARLWAEKTENYIRTGESF